MCVCVLACGVQASGCGVGVLWVLLAFCVWSRMFGVGCVFCSGRWGAGGGVCCGDVWVLLALGVVLSHMFSAKVRLGVCVCVFLASGVQAAVCSVALCDGLARVLNRGYLRRLGRTFASTFTCDVGS